MKSVLIIAHGSKDTKENDAFVEIINMVSEILGSEYIVDGIFISLKDIDFNYKLEELVENGIENITIVPYFLFSGRHIKNTIPNMIKDFVKKYPNIEVNLKNSLGIDRRLAEIVVDRIIE
ncbi:MAG: sirohydrochlorin chelatase [Lachnospirales bacterium]